MYDIRMFIVHRSHINSMYDTKTNLAMSFGKVKVKLSLWLIN